MNKPKPFSPSLTHVDAEGNPGMVDVSDKSTTVRVATAQARVVFPAEALAVLREQEWSTKKGPVTHTAIIAATQAVKRTADLIPFCHPLPIERCRIDIADENDGLRISCEVATSYKTGVEMEAWTGASVAALTIVDMCKSLTPAIRITDVCLLEKTGGKTDFTGAES
jgi:cyclic pyranopterin monophosphate synthase